MALDPSLTSALIKEIGLQLEIFRLSVSFFSIKVIIACFWEFDSSPLSNEQLSPREALEDFPKTHYRTQPRTSGSLG